MFNFDEAIKAATKAAKSTALEALILGPSGAGKSTLCGSFGCKTLYLYSSGENHGVKAARSFGGDSVVPIMFDHEASPDQALERLESILSSTDEIRKLGFGAIVIDGASEIEYLIRNSTDWKKACLTGKGTHNSFEEPRATIARFRPILVALKRLQTELSVHYAMTCILDVRELGSNGDIVEASPRLQGFSVAEALVQQFGDILVVGKMSKNNQVKYKLQFMTELTKTSKEENGTIKRTLNFSPRIAGINVGDGLPNLMDASLSDVVALKENKYGCNSETGRAATD